MPYRIPRDASPVVFDFDVGSRREHLDVLVIRASRDVVDVFDGIATRVHRRTEEAIVRVFAGQARHTCVDRRHRRVLVINIDHAHIIPKPVVTRNNKNRIPQS